jgi:hypothetical protein
MFWMKQVPVIIIPDGIDNVVIEKNGENISISLWIMDYKWLLQNYLVGFIVLSWNINDLCKRKWEINNLLLIYVYFSFMPCCLLTSII